MMRSSFSPNGRTTGGVIAGGSPPPTTSTNGNSNRNKRQLVRPSPHIPWSVDVISAVPKVLKEKLDGPALSGATHGKWACLAFPTGIVYVWQMHVASNLSEPLDVPDEHVRLYFPDLEVTEQQRLRQQKQTTSGDDAAAVVVRPLVALSPPSSLSSAAGDHDSVHLYAVHPTTGWMVLRKVSRRDLKSDPAMARPSSSSTVKVRIDGTTQPSLAPDGEETIRSLTASRTSPSVVVGTSRGQLFYVTHVAVPAGLHVQRVEADAPRRWSRWFGGTGDAAGQSDNEDDFPHVLPVAEAEFLAVSVGSVVHWRAETPLASGHSATFHATTLGSLSSCLEEYQQDWRMEGIMLAELSVDRQSFHCIVNGRTQDGESRLYWIVVQMAGIRAGGISVSRTHWLSRFALPGEVQVLGLVACENQDAYAAFSTTGGNAVIVMALMDGEDDMVQEVDLPPHQVPGLVPHMMDRDMATHGCYMMAKSGLGVRARLLQDRHQPKRPRLGEMEAGSSSLSSRTNLVTVPTLVSHLRSYFWECYQDPAVDRPMPPSLKLATSSDLEQAISVVAVELQQKGDSSSYAIAIEWHKTFVKLVQEGGLYRSLSDDGKWKLFGVGQELTVFGELAHCLMNKYDEDDIPWLGTLQPHGVARWLLAVQTSEVESAWPHADVWHDVLAVALEAALQFREEYLEAMYDVTTERPSQPLWVSHPSLLDMLVQQMRCWKGKSDGVPLALIEAVVKAALLSSSESLPLSSSSPPDPSEIEASESVKRRAISLLRMANEGNDELAFDLCIQYRFFEGLCEISAAHEKKHDAASFSLDPLFGTMEGTDLFNGVTFPDYVLRWHAQRGLHGHVINYGRHSVADLDTIMNIDEQLRKYRWIPAIRNGNFEKATEFCLDNCNEDKGLKNTEWALSMAKLSNKLVAIQSAQVQDRQHRIEKSLELVHAQQMLTGRKVAEKDEVLMLPNELIELAIRKLEDSFEQEERIEMAMVGLAVCNAMSDDKAALDYASRIWAECLLCDGARWTEWSFQGVGDDLAGFREEALATTVFGRLLDQCRKDDGMNKVTYGRHVEAAVIDRVQGDEDRESFTRVLRSVAAAPADSMKMQSLMVSSF